MPRPASAPTTDPKRGRRWCYPPAPAPRLPTLHLSATGIGRRPPHRRDRSCNGGGCEENRISVFRSLVAGPELGHPPGARCAAAVDRPCRGRRGARCRRRLFPRPPFRPPARLGKLLSPAHRRSCVDHVVAKFSVSEQFACKVRRSQDRHRDMATLLQYRAAALIARLQAAGAGGHHLACASMRVSAIICPGDGPEAHHASRLKPDHPMGSGQSQPSRPPKRYRVEPEGTSRYLRPRLEVRDEVIQPRRHTVCRLPRSLSCPVMQLQSSLRKLGPRAKAGRR